MENPTWVPQARNAWYPIPQPIRWLALASALAAMFMYAQEALFYLSLIIAGNAVLWGMERWTASRDRVATEAGIGTRGWGCDPNGTSKFWWLVPLDRFRVDREVRQKTGK